MGRLTSQLCSGGFHVVSARNRKARRQAAASNPIFGLFFLGVEKKIFQGPLATEAAELAWKARHIKIPKTRNPENWCVEYFRDSSSALYRTPNGQRRTLVSALLQKEFRA